MMIVIASKSHSNTIFAATVVKDTINIYCYLYTFQTFFFLNNETKFVAEKKVKKVGAKAPAVKESQQTDSTAKKRSGRKSKDFTPESRSTSGIIGQAPLSDSAMDHEDKEGILFQESLREA